jgi:hypothetical protein
MLAAALGVLASCAAQAQSASSDGWLEVDRAAEWNTPAILIGHTGGLKELVPTTAYGVYVSLDKDFFSKMYGDAVRSGADKFIDISVRLDDGYYDMTFDEFKKAIAPYKRTPKRYEGKPVNPEKAQLPITPFIPGTWNNTTTILPYIQVK